MSASQDAGASEDINHPQTDLTQSETPKGATVSTQIYNLIETAKANGREPYARLRQVLERLPTANSVADIEVLLSWNCTLASPQ